MQDGLDEESAAAAARVNDRLVRLGVNHFDGETNNRMRREELAPVAALMATDESLKGFALNVAGRLGEADGLKTPDYVGQREGPQHKARIFGKQPWVVLLDARKQAGDALTKIVCSAGLQLPMLAARDAKLDSPVRRPLLVAQLHQEQLHDFVKDFLLQQTFVSVDVVVAVLEDGQQIAARLELLARR